MRIEDTIISQIIVCEEFARKQIPHLHKEYFVERVDAILFEEASQFFLKFNELPTKDVLRVQLTQKTGVSEPDLVSALNRLQEYGSTTQNLDWLLDRTEKFCKDRSVYNAIMKAINIIDGKDKVHNKEAIPAILQRALAVQFDTAVGHSYLDDAAARYDFYSKVEEKLAFDIDMLNLITKGGLTRKSLMIILAGTGAGKSLLMQHMAASSLRLGKNVLYITLEMAEEKIAERIDANMLNVDIDKLVELGKDAFCTKISNIAQKTHGRLFVKEYPTGGAHTGHFRGLIEELKTKQNFVPDIVFVDYLGICGSARVKMGGQVNSYAYLKAISEELRGLAVEYNLPLVTAGQLNRNGLDSSDVDLSDVADSAGILHTADLLIALIRTEELDNLNQLMIKQLKNRYGDLSFHKRFVVGLNRSKMKLYNLEASAQNGIMPGNTYSPQQIVKANSDVDDSPPFDLDDVKSLPIAAVSKKSPNTTGFTF